MPDLICPDITLVFFDFGGVLAEEGFIQGLTAVAVQQGLDAPAFTAAAVELVYAGYALGKTTEAQYWQALRNATGLQAPDAVLRNAVLSRFVLRQWMFDLVDKLVQKSLTVAILSDQTNWLDELNLRHGFFSRFHRVFNSFQTGLSKRSTQCFHHALEQMGAMPAEALLVDDASRNCALAQEVGLKTIHYEYDDPFVQFQEELQTFCPDLGKAD